MKPFTTHTGILATLNRANVDTDAIIPKQFLKSIKRTGYGPSAFFDWRYTADGEPDMEFELNQPRFEGRSILVTRNNFGCGSSREHAVWALFQDGYRVIIAPWKKTGGQRIAAFADIFRINAVKNGLLVIELSEDEVKAIFDLVEAQTGLQAALSSANKIVAGASLSGARIRSVPRGGVPNRSGVKESPSALSSAGSSPSLAPRSTIRTVVPTPCRELNEISP